MNIKNKFVWFRDNFLIFKFAHKIYENKCRNRYRGPKDISILASNCIGGEIYHDLGIPFQSPTINLWMHQDDFFKFINKLDFYLSQNLVFLDELEKECKHPVARLGGQDEIVIYFLHYASRDEAERKWEERKQRINRDKLCIIMSDRDGITYDNITQFGKIQCYRKVLFTYKDYPEFPYTFKMPRDGNNEYVINYQKKKWNGFWKWEGKFDCAEWLNGDNQ